MLLSNRSMSRSAAKLEGGGDDSDYSEVEERECHDREWDEEGEVEKERVNSSARGGRRPYKERYDGHIWTASGSTSPSSDVFHEDDGHHHHHHHQQKEPDGQRMLEINKRKVALMLLSEDALSGHRAPVDFKPVDQTDAADQSRDPPPPPPPPSYQTFTPLQWTIEWTPRTSDIYPPHPVSGQSSSVSFRLPIKKRYFPCSVVCALSLDR